MNSLTKSLGLLLLACALAGCGSGAHAAIKARAVTDLSCGEEGIQVTPAPASSGPTESGPYYATGCGQQWRYVVGCNVNGYCPDPQGVDVKTLLTRQAGFDLSCSEPLTISELNRDTFGVTGCSKRASYLLVCGSSRDCKAVQNTQAQ